MTRSRTFVLGVLVGLLLAAVWPDPGPAQWPYPAVTAGPVETLTDEQLEEWLDENSARFRTASRYDGPMAIDPEYNSSAALARACSSARRVPVPTALSLSPVKLTGLPSY